MLCSRRMPRPVRPRRPPTWWQSPDPPWWVRLGIGTLLYAGYLLIDSNTFDADEIRHLVAVLVLGGLGMKK